MIPYSHIFSQGIEENDALFPAAASGLEARAAALQRTLLSRFAEAAEVVQKLRPEAMAAADAVAAAVVAAAAEAEGGDGSPRSTISDAVVVDAAPSVASMDSSLATTPNVSGGGAAPAPGGVVSPMQVDGDGAGSGAKAAVAETAAAATAAALPEIPAEVVSTLGVGVQVACNGLMRVEPGRLRKGLLRMLPHLFKLQELAGE